MPTVTIPYDRIVTAEPMTSRRYFTWLPGQEGQAVLVTRITTEHIYVRDVENGIAIGMERRLRRGTRRRWAVLNPPVQYNHPYLTVQPGNTGDGAVDCPAGEIISFTPSMSVDDHFITRHYIAHVHRTGRSMYVRSFVEIAPTRVPTEHLMPVSQMPGGNVRVVFTEHSPHVGVIIPAHTAYGADRAAQGVYLGREGSSLHHNLVRPDPGSGPFVQPTRVERNTIHRTGSMSSDRGTIIRVVRSTVMEIVGQRMDSTDAYNRDSNSEGVILEATRMQDARRIAPDPGPGPYLTQSRLRVGTEMVYVGDDEHVSWTNPTYVQVNSVNSDQSAERAIECYADSQIHSYQYVRESDLVMQAGFVDPRPPCERCDLARCRCVPCPACADMLDPLGSAARRGSSGSVYHTGCVTQCTRCRNYAPSQNMVAGSAVEGGDGVLTDATYCPSCVRTCRSCGIGRLVSPVTYCTACRMQREDAVRSYGHTTPDMWLGGPLPKNDKGHHVGFYIGFELEVSSQDLSRIRPLRQWSEDNLGHRRALDPKRDGSVRGFEIATQPMTPEFFEDVDWESFFTMLNASHPPTFDYSVSQEPTSHGLHVHIGRIAFERDDIATAMYTYLLAQGDHLSVIGRRAPTGYCEKVLKPASSALYERYNRLGLGGQQARRIYRQGGLSGRDAINLGNDQTIEIRAFRSTRNPEHLRAAVRVVYLAARYIAHLRGDVKAFVSPKALHWDSFIKWVEEVMPEAVPGLTIPFDPAVVPPVPEFDDEDDEGGYDDDDMGPDYSEDEEDEEDDESLLTAEEPIVARPRISIATVRPSLSEMINQASTYPVRTADPWDFR